MKTSSKNLLLFTAFFYSVCALAQNGSELALNTQAPAQSPSKSLPGMSAQQEELASKKQKSINNNIRALAIAKAEIRASQAKAIVHHKDTASPLVKNEPEKPAIKTMATTPKSVTKTKAAPEKSRKPEIKKKDVRKAKATSKPNANKASSKKPGHKKTKAPLKHKHNRKKED